ncbi:hypothetical protein NQ317_007506 [Molorchus minor]|uniref:Cytochrome P450 n=1 Tax=Molorchus minor TaxID=1323400 RepID=A0ABQ9J4Z7_9CUCU|nr:hypothetical protein NQ317_007506 [Molorchus minor]
MLLIILGVLTLVIGYYIRKTYSYWTRLGVQQGFVVPIFGDSWQMILGRHSFADLVRYAYYKCPGTKYSGMYSFHVPLLIVKDPELLKKIAVKDFDHFTDHMNVLPDDIDPMWSKNLFVLRGKKWREMRSLLSPTFTSSKIKMMFVLMVECAENLVQHFSKQEGDILTVEMKDAYTRCTNDIIASAAFGIKVDSLKEPNNEFYVMGKKSTSINSFSKTVQVVICSLWPRLYKLTNMKFFGDDVRNFFRRVIDETIKDRKEKGVVRADMVQLLMQARKETPDQDENDVIDTGFAVAREIKTDKEYGIRNKEYGWDRYGRGLYSPRRPARLPTRSRQCRGVCTCTPFGWLIRKKTQIKELTNEDITAQGLIFFFAGFDSVAGLMCFASYELAVNQDIQNRLRMEIRDTLEEFDGTITYEGILKMKYMDMVVSETLRKWPNAVAIDRVCTKPYTIPPATPNEKPVHLKEGVNIWIPIFAIHRDPQYYPDPDRFDPERFNDENKGDIKPYTYMPFGLGPRNCIGSRFGLLETKIVLFNVLLHFELVPVEKTVIPLKISKGTFQLNSEGGLWLGMKRIKKETDI